MSCEPTTTEYAEALRRLREQYEGAAVDGDSIPGWVIVAEAGPPGQPPTVVPMRRVDVLRWWREHFGA